MIKRENIKQAIDAISVRDPETGYSLNEKLGKGQIEVPSHPGGASQGDDFYFLFDKEKVLVNKFLYYNEGTVPIEQGLLIKYGELVKKQEFSDKGASFSYRDAAEEIRSTGLRFMVTHEIDLAMAQVRKRLGRKEGDPDGKGVSRDVTTLSLLEEIRNDGQTRAIPCDEKDPAVLYRAAVDADTTALFMYFPFCMESLMQVAELNLEFFHVRFFLNCLVLGLEKDLFACGVDRRIVGLLYLALKEQMLYKGLEIKYVATVRGRTGEQTGPAPTVPRGVGTFLVAGTWMLWKTRLPYVNEIFLDSEIGARAFYESVGFQPRGLSEFTLRSPKGYLPKTILMMANNCNDPVKNIFEELRAILEKQIKGLRKKARSEKKKSARKAAIAFVKECLRSEAHPELAETTLRMLRKYRNKIPESEELIEFAGQYST